MFGQISLALLSSKLIYQFGTQTDGGGIQNRNERARAHGQAARATAGSLPPAILLVLAQNFPRLYQHEILSYSLAVTHLLLGLNTVQGDGSAAFLPRRYHLYPAFRISPFSRFKYKSTVRHLQRSTGDLWYPTVRPRRLQHRPSSAVSRLPHFETGTLAP